MTTLAMAETARTAASAILADCRHDNRDCEVGGPGIVGTVCVCVTCWGRHVRARKNADALHREAMREQGRAYWRSRGKAPGDPVWITGSHLMFGAVAIQGVAKVGRAGAYVSCPKHHPGKQLDPKYWRNESAIHWAGAKVEGVAP